MMTPVKDSTRPVNYEMTPQGADKWDQNPSSIDNYNIEVYQYFNQSECAIFSSNVEFGAKNWMKLFFE